MEIFFYKLYNKDFFFIVVLISEVVDCFSKFIWIDK